MDYEEKAVERFMNIVKDFDLGAYLFTTKSSAIGAARGCESRYEHIALPCTITYKVLVKYEEVEVEVRPYIRRSDLSQCVTSLVHSALDFNGDIQTVKIKKRKVIK